MWITKLVPAPVPDTAEADRLLELAFLMTAADGHLADEEQAAFRALVGAVRGAAPSDEDLNELLERFVVSANASGVEGRIQELGPALAPDLRETAFRVSLGLALVDLEASPHEEDHLRELTTLFGLSEERGDALADEVRRAFALE